MGIIDHAKELAELVKKVGDIELYQKIVNLQGEVVALAGRNFEVEAELREVKAKLALKESLTFRQPYYWKEGDSTPYCQHCFEKNGIAFHLDPVYTTEETGAKSRWCRSCHETVFELRSGGRTVELDPVSQSWLSD